MALPSAAIKIVHPGAFVDEQRVRPEFYQQARTQSTAVY